MKLKTFWFGKYKGKEICGIILTHTGYILWLLENTRFRMNEFEQECFDAVAKAKIDGDNIFVYNKCDLKKYMKDENIETPFRSCNGHFGVISKFRDNKIAILYVERYINDMPPANLESKRNIYGSLAAINRNIFTDEELEEDDDNFTMESFLY